MELTSSLIEAEAEAYAAEEPLYTVETEQLETFRSAVASGRYGWRDAEWVVQWYYRRHLGAYPDRRRRAGEDAYGENDFEAVRAALSDAVSADDPAEALDRLTDLSGVDAGVASAFLMYLDPDGSIVVGDREWSVLHEAEELPGPVPSPITTADYARYLDTCRALGDRVGCSMWTLYRALWRLDGEASGARTGSREMPDSR